MANRVPIGARQYSVVLGPNAREALTQIMEQRGLSQRDAFNWALTQAAGLRRGDAALLAVLASDDERPAVKDAVTRVLAAADEP